MRHRLHRRPDDASAAPDAGFVAIDALVALLILSATLVFCLDDLRTATRISHLAEETGAATRLAQALLADSGAAGDGGAEGAEAAAPNEGRIGALRWAVQDRRASDRLCQRTFAARSLRDGRLYRLSTVRRCG